MADISMCKGTDCPKKEKCWRFRAPINEFRQSYLVDVPYNKKTRKCELFWKFKD